MSLSTTEGGPQRFLHCMWKPMRSGGAGRLPRNDTARRERTAPGGTVPTTDSRRDVHCRITCSAWRLGLRLNDVGHQCNDQSFSGVRAAAHGRLADPRRSGYGVHGEALGALGGQPATGSPEDGAAAVGVASRLAHQPAAAPSSGSRPGLPLLARGTEGAWALLHAPARGKNREAVAGTDICSDFGPWVSLWHGAVLHRPTRPASG